MGGLRKADCRRPTLIFIFVETMVVHMHVEP